MSTSRIPKSFAALVTLGALTNPDGSSGVSFKLPYSMGTHDGKATQVAGRISYDPKEPGRVSGSFSVPIASIRTGNEKQDCHLREALGLDYSKSEYPKEHVCNDSNQLPKDGPSSVVFPEIRFEVSRMSAAEGGELKLGGESQVEIDGKWTIHGMTRAARLPMKLAPDGEGYRLSGKVPVSLKAFGVEVKSAHVLFVTISVEDGATAIFDLKLSK